MPSGVYQPTTVSYESRPGNGPRGLSVGMDSSLRVFHKPKPQVALLIFSLISLVAGIAMICSGAAQWLEAEEIQHSNIGNDNTCVEKPVGILLSGVFMIVLGLIALGMYLKVADWRRNIVCPCRFFDKKQSLTRQLQCQSSGGCNTGVMALNPSTDPLVSHTQYATVSELPSLRPEDEERRNLMPDNKECLSSAEESDRMLEPDPRIVLRPIDRVEDA